MNNFPPSPPTVPSIRILGADDPSALFDGGQFMSADLDAYLEDTSFYPCSQGLQPDPNPALNPSPELEDIHELSYLTTTNQPYLTNYGYSLPFPAILQQNASTDRGLSPTTLGSPIPSPTSSFDGSFSPSSFCDSLTLSDSESLLPPSPDTPDGPFFWSSHKQNHQSTESLVSHSSFIPNESFLPHSGTGPHRARAKSSPSRQGPVASKAMLEANGRRRRHPAQFECSECRQTFTALFSLKRHLQSHTGERPFACSVPGCNQRFYNSSDCKRHEKSKKRHKDLLIQ